jgi:putative ABC transport system ATP-binding protein
MVDHVIYLKDGEISKDYYNETKVAAAELEDL